MSAPRRTVLVLVLAVLGIAVAAAITWGTSQLVRQRIGLASEPLTAGRRLLPPVASSPAHVAPSSARPAPTTSTPKTRTQSSPRTTTATPSPPVASPAPRSSTPPSTTPTEAPVESRPVVRGSGSEGGDSSSRRDD
jgi:hypothetical protein